MIKPRGRPVGSYSKGVRRVTFSTSVAPDTLDALDKLCRVQRCSRGAVLDGLLRQEQRPAPERVKKAPVAVNPAPPGLKMTEAEIDTRAGLTSAERERLKRLNGYLK